MSYDNSDFFEQLSTNFAMFIYQILGVRWKDGGSISLRQLQQCVKEANKNDYKLLSLIYGNVAVLAPVKDQDLF